MVNGTSYTLEEVCGWLWFGLVLGAAVFLEQKYVIKDLNCSSKNSLVHLILWMIVAIVFVLIASMIPKTTPDFLATWTSGYILEFALSIDNLFVFQIIFEECKTPLNQRDKALVWGIGLACAFRLFFFILGTELFDWMSWIKIPLGIGLLWIAHATMKSTTTTSSSGNGGGSSTLQRMASGLTSPNSKVRVVASDKYEANGGMWIIEDQVSSYPRLSMLALVVGIIGLVDAVFAIDAVAAKMTQSSNLFVNFSSSIFAMMSFRWLYGLIQDLSSSFHLVKFGIGLVLGYVGLELLLSIWIVVPASFSCWVIVLVLCGSVVASVFVGRIQGAQDPDEEFGVVEMSDAKHTNQILQE